MRHCDVCNVALPVLWEKTVCPDCERKDFSGNNNQFWAQPAMRGAAMPDEIEEAMDEVEQPEWMQLLKQYDDNRPEPEPVYYNPIEGWDDDYDWEDGERRRGYRAVHPLDKLLNITPPPPMPSRTAMDDMMWHYLHMMDGEVTKNKAKQAVEKMSEDSDGSNS